MPRPFLLALAITIAGSLAGSLAAAEQEATPRLAAACAGWSVDHFMLVTWAAKAADLAAILDKGDKEARNGAQNLRRLIDAARPGTDRTAALMAGLCPNP